jgi:hypothetical protein
MNARLIHISIAARETVPISSEQVLAVIEKYSLDWMTYAAGNYVIWTQVELAHWTAMFRQVPNMENGYFLIVPIDPNAPIEGWLPQYCWDWMFKFRPHTPLPPSSFDPNFMKGLLGGG